MVPEEPCSSGSHSTRDQKGHDGNQHDEELGKKTRSLCRYSRLPEGINLLEDPTKNQNWETEPNRSRVSYLLWPRIVLVV